MLPEIKSATISNYSKVFLSKKQYLIDDKTNFKSEIPKIISIINNRLNINHDWSSVRGASSLTNNQLIQIQQIVSNETQSELVAIFSPYIEPHLKSIFGNRLEYNIRVSAQIKGFWTIKEIEKKRQGFFIDNIFHEHNQKNNIFFPTLKERGITTCIHMGDVTDRRKYISFRIANDFRERFVNRFKEMGIDLHITIGNHDTYYKNTSEINSMQELVGSDNFKIYTGPEVVEFDGTPILFIPWINSNNYEASIDALNTANADIVMGHLEVNGFEMHKGQMAEGK